MEPEDPGVVSVGLGAVVVTVMLKSGYLHSPVMGSKYMLLINLSRRELDPPPNKLGGTPEGTLVYHERTQSQNQSFGISPPPKQSP